VSKRPSDRDGGFWLVSGLRQVRFRLCFGGAVIIEFHEGPACKVTFAGGSIEIEDFLGPPRKVASVSSVHQAVQLANLYLRQRCGLDALPGHDPRGFILSSRQLAKVIEDWRASTGAEVEVFRKIFCEDDPRNYGEVLVIRSGSRQVVFGEPGVWGGYGVSVQVSEGSIQKRGYVARREDVEELLDLYLRHHCPLNRAGKLLRWRF